MQRKLLSKFADDESGATAIEYALIAAIVSVAIVASLKGVSTSLQGAFTSIVTGFESANE